MRSTTHAHAFKLFLSELVSPTMAETHKIGIRRSCVWSLYAAWVLLLQLLSLVFQEEVKRSDAVAAKNKLTILSQGYDSTTFFACAHYSSLRAITCSSLEDAMRQAALEVRKT